ncbi:glucose PTS transporter subunit EIIB [Vibrio scophthalmi]|uniref:glucose PTS transporter subunit EIIB n=1 Tax=Vibrio scophthalmi TaxID=45658 RepID=UPI003EBA3FF4
MFAALRKIFTALTRVNPNLEQEADIITEALGGIANIKEIGACATRLRPDLHDMSRLNEKALKDNGAIGIVHVDSHHVQIIYGLKANSYAQCIEQKLN